MSKSTLCSIRHWAVLAGGLIVALPMPLIALQQAQIEGIEARRDHYGGVARQIWEWAEVGYQEEQSSELLKTELEAAGFSIESDIAGMPTAFVASYGSGGPVIGLLAEYDALPGISQDAVPERKPIIDGGAGHACGHHLFGTGSVAAAIAVKEWLDETGHEGTIRLYGTPAEEGGAGKVYMVRDGLFDDVDVALHWHPGSRNSAQAGRSLANKSAKFRFRGYSAHAAGAPERGRSALDGVEAMNHMVNLMREHVPQETRIHYAITHGGFAPNVVPDFAEVYYYVRHPYAPTVLELFERVARAAEGAAMGTGTEMEYEVIHGLYDLVPNVALGQVMDANLRKVGGVEYTEAERVFARQIQATFEGGPSRPLGSEGEIVDFGVEGVGGGSTDVGDISWVVPTAGLSTATWVPGTSAHSWQAVAAGGTDIGTKGMMVAAKTLALTMIELFQSPDVIAAAWEELAERRGADFEYTALLGDRPPPLDYRR
ncbi:M20 family metallopeptidase [Candidatus Palauibacter sp.]|uniref:M20 family metallopeptidase n=1 Tax=Candidatus Palauibacter sp. TaxID=3101350 RepID=UPI003B02D371